jgi:hypothetical protein
VFKGLFQPFWFVQLTIKVSECQPENPIENKFVGSPLNDENPQSRAIY